MAHSDTSQTSFGWLKSLFKREPVPMMTVDLHDVRNTIYQGVMATAPCHRAHMPLYAAAMSGGAADFRAYDDLWKRLVPTIDEHWRTLRTVEIPANSRDFYRDVEKALKRAVRGLRP